MSRIVKGDSVKGLPVFTASAPEILAKEKAELAALEGKSFPLRWRGDFAKTGPGWLQRGYRRSSGDVHLAFAPVRACGRNGRRHDKGHVRLVAFEPGGADNSLDCNRPGCSGRIDCRGLDVQQRT